jgi:hypothetical protein
MRKNVLAEFKAVGHRHRNINKVERYQSVFGVTEACRVDGKNAHYFARCVYGVFICIVGA